MFNGTWHILLKTKILCCIVTCHRSQTHAAANDKVFLHLPYLCLQNRLHNTTEIFSIIRMINTENDHQNIKYYARKQCGWSIYVMSSCETCCFAKFLSTFHQLSHGTLLMEKEWAWADLKKNRTVQVTYTGRHLGNLIKGNAAEIMRKINNNCFLKC